MVNIRPKFEKKKCLVGEGDIEQTRNQFMTYTKGHIYVKTGRQIAVPVLRTPSNDALYLYKVS